MSDEKQPKLELVPPPAAEAKPFWQSRTLWVGAVGLVAKYIPGPIGDFLRANEATLAELALAAAVALRLDTRASISWRF